MAETNGRLSVGHHSTDEYLDLMLEWGTILDIPDLVAEIRRLKAEIQKLESRNER